MKTLVTGGAGFIGSHLIDLLIEKKYDIRILVRKGKVHSAYKNPTEKQTLERFKKSGVEIVYGNLLDKKSLEDAVKGCGIVYHLAAIAHTYEGLPEEVYFNVNVLGTKNLLDVCLSNKIKKFVYVSTIESCGPSLDGKPVSETKKPKPNCLYGQSKLGGEVLSLYYYKKYGLPVVVTRPPMIYGDRNPLLLRFFKTIKKGIFPIFGSGNSLFEFCYVKNQAYGIYLVGERGKPGEVYFISEGSYRIIDVVKKTAELMGIDLKIIYVPKSIGYTIGLSCEALSKILPFSPFRVRGTGRPYISRRTIKWTTNDLYICDISKARKQLDYKPLFSLKEGLERTIKWYKEKKLL
jgi:nucleoside-diphosphate-sugar epimerase